MSKSRGENWLQREDLGDVTVVRINVPRLGDDDSTREVFDAIYALVDTMGRNKLVVNLANVKLIFSLGVGKLVLLNSKTKTTRTGGRLALCHLLPDVAQVLNVTHVDEILKIYETEAEAIQALSGTG